MDTIVNGVLQGSISGNVIGSVTTASRNADSGIEFDGVTGYVDFGMHDGNCFQSPDACNAGVTFSMWLRAGDNSGTVVPLDTGSYNVGKAGYCMKLSNRALMVFVKFVSDNGRHRYELDGFNQYDQQRWEHIVWTWHSTQGIRVFLNGCDTDPGGKKGRLTYTVLDWMVLSNGVPFVLGARARGFSRKANMELDDLYIWNQVLTENEVWRIYTNGARMSALETEWCVPLMELLSRSFQWV